MKITVYNGNQIGGCITVIESNKGTKICLDIGENLPSAQKEKRKDLNIEGLTYGTPDVKAVFVSHYHGDHVGLYDKILPNIDIYIGEISKNIYKILQQRLVYAKIIDKRNLEIIDKFKTYKIPEKIHIDDITVTPIGVDHSAFDAHMLLVECDGKKVLYTGDFRCHGQRGKSAIPAIEKYAGKCDVMICEGTTLSRNKENPMTETELQIKAKNYFQDNKYSFVLCSSTNIDRIAAIHQAALSARRLFVCDKYQKDLLAYIDSVSKSNLYKFNGKMLSYDDNILPKMKDMGFVMLVRDNYISDKVIKEFKNNSLFIYSQWKGYLDPEFKQYEHLQKFVPRGYKYLHTSGHGDFETIKKICHIVNPKILIPIHGENPEEFNNMELQNCKIEKIENKSTYIV